jgi:hypothetical protein
MFETWRIRALASGKGKRLESTGDQKYQPTLEGKGAKGRLQCPWKGSGLLRGM